MAPAASNFTISGRFLVEKQLGNVQAFRSRLLVFAYNSGFGSTRRPVRGEKFFLIQKGGILKSRGHFFEIFDPPLPPKWPLLLYKVYRVK